MSCSKSVCPSIDQTTDKYIGLIHSLNHVTYVQTHSITTLLLIYRHLLSYPSICKSIGSYSCMHVCLPVCVSVHLLSFYSHVFPLDQ